MKQGNLISYIQAYPDLDTVRLCYETALVLQYLHSKSVIHGNVQPRAYFRSRLGSSKLIGVCGSCIDGRSPWGESVGTFPFPINSLGGRP
ncbi:uncharacterized protein EI90DRAFT_1306383 [Cantharellus anzutake]|uniref:uncharacterized protein n=1 Tax=Cantharellus anzutake TaxID=1750568 RepID=UPI001907C843|nr:uncharacterized protein EI90DRAFT_1306383 [Cantharellus anzutake]KAF8342139.1 hypothetical protein EI90DRAFT_1306383 [Cantharellus anzutake]